jgi:hypothetical protein
MTAFGAPYGDIGIPLRVDGGFGPIEDIEQCSLSSNATTDSKQIEQPIGRVIPIDFFADSPEWGIPNPTHFVYREFKVEQVPSLRSVKVVDKQLCLIHRFREKLRREAPLTPELAR